MGNGIRRLMRASKCWRTTMPRSTMELIAPGLPWIRALRAWRTAWSCLLQLSALRRYSGLFRQPPIVNWRHENLMRLFFRALRSFVKPGGTVKVASNAGAVGVRYSYIISSATENEFVHVETVPFKEWQLHRYLRSYGDKRDAIKRVTTSGTGYTAQKEDSDMVYSFCYAPSGQTLSEQEIRIPPTKAELQAALEGPLKGSGPGRSKVVNDLYNRFLSEVSGVHVG